jgi:hypothetical protein
VVHAQDVDTRSARFFRSARHAQRRQLRDPRLKLEPVAFADFLVEPVLQHPASFSALPTSRIELVSESKLPARRRLSLRVQPAAAARCVVLWADSASRVRTLGVDGTPVHPLVRFSPAWDNRLWRLLNPAPLGDPWNLRHCAADSASFSIEIESQGEGPLELRIATRWDRLLPQVPTSELRGTTLQPSASANATVVSQKLAL